MRNFLVLAILVAVASSCTLESSSSLQQPNIILIMADDLGYETLGVNGGSSYRTPNLDALANAGMRFTQVYATPLCTPSRVQLMTGKYNFRNYIGFGLLDPSERTFAHYLQDAGYRTAVVGKWQLYGNARQQELAGGRTGSVPEQAGFDEHAVWQVKELGSRYKHPRLNVSGSPTQDYPGAYGPDQFVEHIEDFLERHRDQRFLLYYPMVLTHDPFQPTPDHPDYAEFSGRGVNDTTYFKDYVAYMDGVIGRIVDQLDRLGLRENTLLLFTGDNGTDRKVTSTMGDRVIRGLKGYTTEAGTHVPLIASWPGTIASGQVNDNLIDFTDFLPTLLEAAHLETPEDLGTDGLSFYSQLVGQADTVRAWVFCDYAPRWGSFSDRRFVHDRDWKLYGDGTFYHIGTDPEELSPVADEVLAADVIQLKQQFQAVLDSLLTP